MANKTIQEKLIYAFVLSYTPLYKLHSGQNDYKQLQEALVQAIDSTMTPSHKDHQHNHTILH